jgi:hypothetical protein
MNRRNTWNPLGRNNPSTGGNSERNWFTRVHRDTPQSGPENTRQPVPDFLKRQATGDSGRERAGKFVRKVAELVALGQIPLADQIMFHDWLHPDGKNLDLNRATSLAMQEQYYYQQYYQGPSPQRAEEAEIHFLKSFLEKLSKIGDDDDDGEHKHDDSRKRKRDKRREEEALEAYEAGKQEGEDKEYYRNKHYRDSYYRNKEKLENNPNNDPLG